MSDSRPPEHFARLYEANPDPWGFTTDPYEQQKYRRSIKVLTSEAGPRLDAAGKRRFSSGLEVGCSIGVLTRLLAPLCESLLGLDVVDQALAEAAKRCADQPWVRFLRMQMPAEWPGQRFDLIVFSEVLYFLTQDDIRRCAERVSASLLPGARVLLVNWLGQSDDPCSGDEAATRFIDATAGTLRVVRQERQAGYRLDLLSGS